MTTRIPHDRAETRLELMHVDRNGLEVLEREECLRLLAGATIGRLGITIGTLPVVLPVNQPWSGRCSDHG